MLRMLLISALSFRFSRCFALLLVLASCWVNVSAAELQGIYEVTLTVQGQGEKERRAAYVEAFRTVLIRVTGDRQVLSDLRLKGAIAKARNYVQRFDYTTEADVGHEHSEAEVKERNSVATMEPLLQPPQQRLHIIFDDRAINRLLHQFRLPVWGRLRPTLLILLAVDEGSHRYLLAAEGYSELSALVEEAAQRRALPVILPLLDLDDQQNISFSDVWGDFAQALQQASRRYQPGALLVGRAYRPSMKSDGWQLRWGLYSDELNEHWPLQSKSLAAGLTVSLDQAIDLLAQHYARDLTAEASGAVMLRVSDIHGSEDYAKVMRYLNTLEIVDAVALKKVEDDRLECLLQVRGKEGFLRKTISFGDTLALPRAASGIPDIGFDGVLNYRLLP